MWERMCWLEPDLIIYWTEPERCMAGRRLGIIRSAMGLLYVLLSGFQSLNGDIMIVTIFIND